MLIFLTYWLCNPNLGQTTFWLVGASNYLFTNLWILLYLNVAFSNYLNVRKTFRILIFIFIAFAAGLSNENTAPIIVAFGLGMFIYKWLVEHKISFNWLIGFFFSLLGAIVLLAAPGNQVRQQAGSPIFAQEPMWLKIHDFFINGSVFYTFSNYSILFPLFILVLIGIFYIKSSSTQAINWMIIFFLMAICSNFMFAFSPEIPLRALNGAFILFLVSFSFILQFLLNNVSESKMIRNISAVLFISLIFVFLFSYVLEVNSFNLARKESTIRVNTLKRASAQKANYVNIPSWYIGRVMRPHNDSYDKYFNVKLGEHYGFMGQVKEQDTHFNYTDKSLLQEVQKAIKNNDSFEKINIYNNNENLNKKTMVVFLKKDTLLNRKYDVKLNTERGSMNFLLNSDQIVSVDGFNFVSFDLGTYLYKNKITNVEIKDSNNTSNLYSVNY